MKKIYLQPEVIITTIQAHENFLTMSGGDTGMTSGGNSNDLSNPDPDVRKRNEFDDDELLDEELIQEASGWKNGLW